MFYQVKDFNPDNFDEYGVMVCEDEEEAKFFRRLLHSTGRKWFLGEPYIDFNEHMEARNFIFNRGAYILSIDNVTNFAHVQILKFSDFFSREQPFDEFVVGSFEDIL